MHLLLYKVRKYQGIKDGWGEWHLHWILGVVHQPRPMAVILQHSELHPNYSCTSCIQSTRIASKTLGPHARAYKLMHTTPRSGNKPIHLPLHNYQSLPLFLTFFIHDVGRRLLDNLEVSLHSLYILRHLSLPPSGAGLCLSWDP